MLVLETGGGWPDDLMDEMAQLGLLVVRVDDGKLLPFFVLAGGVHAVLLDVRSLGLTEVLGLRKIRQHAPRTAVVVVSSGATQADMMRAVEAGATSFLALPTSAERVVAAVRSDRRRWDQCDFLEGQ